ncbi:uncharacterized protein METZ01_LOCUS467645, partial [marine metagenome]
ISQTSTRCFTAKVSITEKTVEIFGLIFQKMD